MEPSKRSYPQDGKLPTASMSAETTNPPATTIKPLRTANYRITKPKNAAPQGRQPRHQVAFNQKKGARFSNTVQPTESAQRGRPAKPLEAASSTEAAKPADGSGIEWSIVGGPYRVVSAQRNGELLGWKPDNIEQTHLDVLRRFMEVFSKALHRVIRAFLEDNPTITITLPVSKTGGHSVKSNPNNVSKASNKYPSEIVKGTDFATHPSSFDISALLGFAIDSLWVSWNKTEPLSGLAENFLRFLHLLPKNNINNPQTSLLDRRGCCIKLRKAMMSFRQIVRNAFAHQSYLRDEDVADPLPEGSDYLRHTRVIDIEMANAMCILNGFLKPDFKSDGAVWKQIVLGQIQKLVTMREFLRANRGLQVASARRINDVKSKSVLSSLPAIEVPELIMSDPVEVQKLVDRLKLLLDLVTKNKGSIDPKLFFWLHHVLLMRLTLSTPPIVTRRRFSI